MTVDCVISEIRLEFCLVAYSFFPCCLHRWLAGFGSKHEDLALVKAVLARSWRSCQFGSELTVSCSVPFIASGFALPSARMCRRLDPL